MILILFINRTMKIQDIEKLFWTEKENLRIVYQIILFKRVFMIKKSKSRLFLNKEILN